MTDNATTQHAVPPSARVSSIRVLAENGRDLGSRYQFSWAATHQEVARALAFDESRQRHAVKISLVALVGGASSGKSTLFNNLLQGHYASQVQVHSHTTLGPILAVHQDHRGLLDSWVRAENCLLPTHPPLEIGIDESASGEVGRLSIVWHQIDPLRNLLLFDMPDFTSEAARREGDLALNLLPWFDRLLVLLDCERWSDRQSLSELGRRSQMLGQPRMAVFNCTEELPEPVHAEHFAKPCAALGAEAWTFIDHRRGRGLRRLPVEAVDSVVGFATQPSESRYPALVRVLGRKANEVLNAQEQRAHALEQLRRLLNKTTEAIIPSMTDCLQAMMTDPERNQLRWMTRVMGATNSWGPGMLIDGLRSVLVSTAAPLKGLLGGKTPNARKPLSSAERLDQGRAHFDEQCHKQWRRLRGLAVAAAFQSELEQDGVNDCFSDHPPDGELFIMAASEKLVTLDQALSVWNKKVEQECRGLSPNFFGAAGGTVLGAAIILIAVQGPIALLTFPAAMAALSASLTKLAVAAGAGALLGKHAGRFAHAVYEQLLGSPELQAVHHAAEAYRAVLSQHARQCSRSLCDQGARFVMPGDEPLLHALQTLRLAGDVQ